MKALVTGASGFIGGHMIERLLSDGHEVIALDVYLDRKAETVADGKPGTLHYFTADVADKSCLKPAYFRGVDWIFHFAGKSNIVPSIEHPREYHDVNVTGTLNVLEAAKKSGTVKKFVYAASSSCYGIPDVYPTPEKAEIRPEYPYALTKYLGEQYVMHWGRVYDLPVVSLRLFNVYGPRIRTYGTYGPVISIFTAQKLAGAPYTVVGDGKQTRDFTFVTDVVDAFVKAAESPVRDEVFNVGSGGTYSINRMVELMGGPVVHIPKRPGEPDITFADIRKIRKVLGWKPLVGFEAGMKTILDNLDYWKNATVWTPESIGKATRSWFAYLDKGKKRNV